MFEWVLDFYSALSFDMEMTISLPELLAEQIGAEEGIEFPSVIRLPMRFVDGVLYMDLQPLAATIPDLQADLEDEGVSGWIRRRLPRVPRGGPGARGSARRDAA